MENSPAANPLPPVQNQQPPAWPIAIGIIAIVFGLFGAGATIVGALGQTALVGFAAQAMGDQAEAYKELVGSWSIPLIIVAIVSTLVALVLLLGGIMLLLRKRSGAALLKIWSILKILLLCVTIPINFIFQKQTMALMTEAVTQPGQELGMQVGGIAGAVFGVIWGLALPIFLLVWFALKKTKADVAEMK